MDSPFRLKKKKPLDILDDKDAEEIIDPTFSEYDDDIVPEFRKGKKEKSRFNPYKVGGGRRAVKK